jgi:hypothetical protein
MAESTWNGHNYHTKLFGRSHEAASNFNKYSHVLELVWTEFDLNKLLG